MKTSCLHAQWPSFCEIVVAFTIHPFPSFSFLCDSFLIFSSSFSLYSDSVPSNHFASLCQGRPFKDLLQGAESNSQRYWLLCASICGPRSDWPVWLVLLMPLSLQETFSSHCDPSTINRPLKLCVLIDWCIDYSQIHSDSIFGGNMLWIVYFSHPRSHVYTMRPPRWICWRDTCDASFGVGTSDLRRCNARQHGLRLPWDTGDLAMIWSLHHPVFVAGTSLLWGFLSAF